MVLIAPHAMDHPTRSLAGTPHCNVLHCGCGMLHLTLGPITMRVEQSAARTLRDVLGAALAVLDDEARASEAQRRGQQRGPTLRLASSRGDDLSS